MKRSIQWLPIVLMMFCIGCYIKESETITGIEKHRNHCHYRMSGGNNICAPCGWYKIGDKPIRPITDTTKQ